MSISGDLSRPATSTAPAVRPAGAWREFGPLPLDDVLLAAIRAFAEVGYHGASVRRIAQGGSLSVAGLYHHYPTKQDLLRRVFEVAEADLAWRVDAAATMVEHSDTDDARLGRTVEAVVLFAIHRGHLAVVLRSEARNLDPSTVHLAGALAGISTIVRQRVAALAGRDLPVVAHAIVTMCLTVIPEGTIPSDADALALEYAGLAGALVRSRIHRETPG